MKKQSKARSEDVNVVKVVNMSNELGRVLPDGVMVDQIYDPMDQDAHLVVRSPNGEISVVREYAGENDLIRPIVDDAIKEGMVLLPTTYLAAEDRKQLCADLRQAIRKYVELYPSYEEIAARFIMMTWVYDRFQKVAYLRIIGPPGSGKSRLLDVMLALAYHSSKMGVSLTPANVYRWLDVYPGTLVIDEADFGSSNARSTLTQVLNGGYDRNRPVLRCLPGSLEAGPQFYKTFGPKVLASRRLYKDDALESRLLTLTSKQLTRADVPEVIPNFEDWDEMIELRNRLLGYRLGYFHSIDPQAPVKGLENYEPRLREILRPLMQILGEDQVPEEVRDFADQYNEERLAHLGMGDEGIVAQAMLSLYDTDRPLPVVQEVKDEANRNRPQQYPLHSRAVGEIIRGLGLSTRRRRRGYEVVANPENVAALARRFGFEWNIDGAGQ